MTETTPKRTSSSDPMKLAEIRTQNVLTSLRRFASLRRDGKHPYTEAQIEAMLLSIESEWASTKAALLKPAFKLPGAEPAQPGLL